MSPLTPGPRWPLLIAGSLAAVLLLPATTTASQVGPADGVTGGGGAPLAVAAALPQSPPEGGPVDDGWLPADGSSFSQFSGEPAPAGGPVWPGVRRDARTTRTASGQPVDVQILHLDAGAPVVVQPTLATGSVGGVAPVSAHGGDPLLGAVASTNGAFWLREPFGEPNGYLARDGGLVSDAETQGAGPRGTVGWTADGQVLIDRIDSVETLGLPDGTVILVGGINRGHREEGEQYFDGVDSMLAYTPDYGPPATLTQPVQSPGNPPTDLAGIRVAAPRWPATGVVDGTVTGITRDQEAAFVADPGEVLVLATGVRARQLDGLQVGDTVRLGTEIRPLDPALAPAWTSVVRGLAGGPHIVEGGQVTDPAGWVEEGFEPQVHSDVRAPRTAIGVTAEGRTLMVTVDGRRPGITVGFTIAELARYMIALGAVDALSIDGGASSQMVVDGILRNVPCCDQGIRAVATSLQVTHTEPFDGTDRLRGAGRVDTAAAVARHAHPDGAETAVIAVASAFPDALAGGPLAAVAEGPLLLTGRDGLPQVTAEVLRDLGVERVVLLGGPAVIDRQVVEDLTDMGIGATRLSGASRFETAAAIARALITRVQATPGQRVDRAFLVAAGTFADALVAAGPGGILDMPILLSERDRLHPETLDVLDGLDEVVLVGGTSRLGESLEADLRRRGLEVTRLAGDSRFGTAREVNGWLAEQTPLGADLVVATGGDFPDALSGGPLAAALRAPLMILPAGAIDADPDAAAFFDDLPPRSGVDVLGGLGVVSSYQQWQLEQLVTAGPPATCELPVDPPLGCPG